MLKKKKTHTIKSINVAPSCHQKGQKKLSELTNPLLPRAYKLVYYGMRIGTGMTCVPLRYVRSAT